MKAAPALALCAALLAACITDTGREELLAAEKSQVELRSLQTRAFDTEDREQTLRTVIATLQDLDFVIDKADEKLGAVSATKLDGYSLRITVTVRAGRPGKLLVRASAEFNQRAVTDPEPYRNFFAALSKAMFLTAHQVEGG